MYVNWGLIVKVSKVRHDCRGETLSSIQNPAPCLPLSPTPGQCSSLYVLRRLTLSHVSVYLNKRANSKRNYKMFVCTRVFFLQIHRRKPRHSSMSGISSLRNSGARSRRISDPGTFLSKSSELGTLFRRNFVPEDRLPRNSEPSDRAGRPLWTLLVEPFGRRPGDDRLPRNSEPITRW